MNHRETEFDRWREFVRDEYGWKPPMEWEVCPECNGRGTMTLKRLAFSADDFAEDPDFAEDYWNGVYDEPCDECNGRTTVERMSDHAPAEMVASWREWVAEEAADRHTRYMESGGYG